MKFKKLAVVCVVGANMAAMSACSGGPSIYSVGGAGATAAGLNTYESGKDFDQTLIDGFVKGKTTKAEVIAALGDPNAVQRNADGDESLDYTYYTSKETTKSAVAGVAASMAGYLGSIVGREDETTYKNLSVNLTDGIYTGYNIYSSAEKSGSGLVR